MSAIELRAVAKSYGRTPVLCGVDLDVPVGSTTTILGASGSGKTTLLRLIAGFEHTDAGTIAIGGHTLDDGRRTVGAQHRGVGYVPQDGALFPHLTVTGNVGFGLARRARGEVSELLGLVGIGDLARRYPHQLSGGQQQRVALARALAIRPAVVLLDEPFSSLDASLRSELREDVARILGETATTTVLVTHDQDEALSLSDLVAVLRDGAIVQNATPRELYVDPLDGELAQFVGEANLIDGVLSDGFVETPLGRLRAQWRGSAPATKPCPVTILLRPEQIELRAAGDRDGVAGRVVKTGYHGHDTVLHVEIAHEHRERRLIVRTHGDVQHAPGTEVALSSRGPVHVWAREGVSA